jgi:hypothetical protein
MFREMVITKPFKKQAVDTTFVASGEGKSLRQSFDSSKAGDILQHALFHSFFDFDVCRAFDHFFELRAVGCVARLTPTADKNFVIVRIGAAWLIHGRNLSTIIIKKKKRRDVMTSMVASTSTNLQFLFENKSVLSMKLLS